MGPLHTAGVRLSICISSCHGQGCVLRTPRGLWALVALLENSDVFSTQQPQAVSFNHSNLGIGPGISIKIGNCFIILSTRMSRRIQTHAIAALQCWSEQTRGSSLPSAMQAYREKTPGESQKVSDCDLKNRVSPEYQTAFFLDLNYTLSFYCWS